jgi:hypothetical protein
MEARHFTCSDNFASHAFVVGLGAVSGVNPKDINAMFDHFGQRCFIFASRTDRGHNFGSSFV